MTKRMGGFRRKTRDKLKRSAHEKGRIDLRRYFQSFKLGESVCFKADPSFQGGMYFPRFHGKIGVVNGKVGECYKIIFNDKNKEKTLIVHPVHLKRR